MKRSRSSSRGSLRWRLALACALTTLITFAAAGIVVSYVVERSGERRLEGRMRGQADSLVSGDDEVTLRDSAWNVPIYAQVVNERGVVTATTDPLRAIGALDPPAQGRPKNVDDPEYRDARAGGTQLRLLEVRPSKAQTLQIGVPRNDLDASVDSLRRVLVAGTILSALVSLLIGRLLAGRLLRPLGRILATAQQIGRTGDLDRRVPGAEGHDELGRLARVFNGMVGRLKLAQDGQRRFVADASHELKTPITSLSGNLEFLQRQGLDERTKHEVVRDLRDDVDRLQVLAKDLVELARADAGGALRGESIRIDHAVQRAVNRIARTAQTHTITQELAAVTGTVDPESVERIVANLVSNAVNYTPDGTNIHVSISPAPDDAGRSCALIVVADDGPGMAPADAARAFDRFHRGETSRGTGGSGLGLAIVQQAARSHLGSVELDATSGGGCTFTVLLPLAGLDAS